MQLAKSIHDEYGLDPQGNVIRPNDVKIYTDYKDRRIRAIDTFLSGTGSLGVVTQYGKLVLQVLRLVAPSIFVCLILLV